MGSRKIKLKFNLKDRRNQVTAASLAVGLVVVLFLFIFVPTEVSKLVITEEEFLQAKLEDANNGEPNDGEQSGNKNAEDSDSSSNQTTSAGESSSGSSTPNTEPAPDDTSNPPATPPSAGFNPITYDWQNNVGLSNPSVLGFHDGPMVLDQDGQVLENMEVRGRVTVTGKNVIIRNSHIYGYWYSVLVDWGSSGSLTIEDSEIGHASYPANAGLAGNNVTARRLNIHHSEDGIKAGANSSYEYMYVHDMEGFAADPHADALQDEGAGGWALSKCYFDPTRSSDGDPGNASAIIKSDLGAINSFLIEDCFFGGGNYTLYVFPATYGCPTNGTVRRVHFAPTARYGLFSAGGCDVVGNYNEWSNNEVLRWSGSSWVTDYQFAPPWQ